MRRLLVLCGGALGALTLSGAAQAALEVRLTVKPAQPRVGAEAVIELRTFIPLARRDGSCCRLVLGDPRGYPFRVEAVSPEGKVARVRVFHGRRGLWKGVFRFDASGRWQVRVANYGPSYRAAPGTRPRVVVHVRPSAPRAPPRGFGALGKSGCEPASPRNQAGRTFPAFGEVFGTAVGGQFWALFFGGSWTGSDSAVVDGVLAKKLKIVFRMTGVGVFDIAAVGPNAAHVRPVAGPTFHPSSTWTRPGLEWGTLWVFPQPGCWRIHAKRGDVAGDVWLLVRS